MAEKQIDAFGIFENYLSKKTLQLLKFEAHSRTKETFENVDDESIQENVSPRIILRVILNGS